VSKKRVKAVTASNVTKAQLELFRDKMGLLDELDLFEKAELALDGHAASKEYCAELINTMINLGEF
jgi:hypothetical protein